MEVRRICEELGEGQECDKKSLVCKSKIVNKK